MDISIFFEPIELKGYEYAEKTRRKHLGDLVKAYIQPNSFPDYQGADLAILGVSEDRHAIGNKGCAQAPDAIRKELYKLYQGNFKLKMVDLGNLTRGNSIDDTHFALTATLEELLRNNVTPIILGGGQDLTFSQYRAYEKIGKIVNIAVADPMFDLGHSEQALDSRSYMSRIILQQPNYLFNYANIGYQSYFIDQDALRLMKNLFFDTYRLGIVHESLEEVEPIVRNADMLTFDISAVRFSDAPGNANATPNGFYGEEACQIVRYAGLSDKLTSIGFYEVNPRYDKSGQTAHLVAQMIWYFMDGFYNRAHDFPFKNEEDYLKYRVSIRDHKEEIVFYKSKKTDRWWMEIPLPAEQRIKYERHYLVPCSYKDYQVACENDIPDRWWMVYQKLM